jgi:hypothetical protein
MVVKHRYEPSIGGHFMPFPSKEEYALNKQQQAI